MSEGKKIAAIATAYYPFSHADVIISKFLKGFPADGELQAPKVWISCTTKMSGWSWRANTV